MQHAGPRASAAAGELHPPARNPHFGARHLTLLASSPPRAPRWPGVALQSNVVWLSPLCKSPEKEEKN